MPHGQSHHIPHWYQPSPPLFLTWVVSIDFQLVYSPSPFYLAFSSCNHWNHPSKMLVRLCALLTQDSLAATHVTQSIIETVLPPTFWAHHLSSSHCSIPFYLRWPHCDSLNMLVTPPPQDLCTYSSSCVYHFFSQIFTGLSLSLVSYFCLIVQRFFLWIPYRKKKPLPNCCPFFSPHLALSILSSLIWYMLICLPCFPSPEWILHKMRSSLHSLLLWSQLLL